ncbi:MFS transporter [Epibacterium sp. SM1979]|uniref:MFS transporter n=1 Tax=Tritonibacter litoralis TaxID=2662264 RepID=A0A843YEV0_9RHOB|nr:MFS transporter [Tritonibacter litoralis]MQQ07984.1 MFS transporter [Tritonibacter litoralis]
MIDTYPTARLWTEPAAFALLLAASMMVMGNATLSPALPLLAAEFADDPLADWLSRFLVPAPSAAVVIFAPLAGRMADTMGRKPLMLWGVALFAGAGCAGFWLPDLRWMIASRLVLGVGMALILTTQIALLGDLFQGDRRQKMLGFQISARNISGLICISGAGVLATWDARLPFAIYGLAFLFLWVIARGLPDDGATRATPGDQSPAEGDAKPGRWMRSVMIIAVFQGILNMSFFVMPTQVPFFLNSLGVAAPVYAGATLGVMTLAAAIAAMRFAQVSAILSNAGTCVAGFGSMALGYGTLALAPGLEVAMLGATIVGIGYALASPVFAGMMLKAAPLHWRGRASGLLTTATFVGQLVSPALSIPAIQAWGFPVTYGILAVFLLLLAGGWAIWSGLQNAGIAARG